MSAVPSVSSKEILEKTRQLALLIAESAEVDTFRQAEQKVKRNEKVQSLISQIKQKQKELVHFQHLQRLDWAEQVERELAALQEELDAIPVVEDFKRTQLEINDLLQMVTHVISNTLTDQIILSTGGDPLTGQTGLAGGAEISSQNGAKVSGST